MDSEWNDENLVREYTNMSKDAQASWLEERVNVPALIHMIGDAKRVLDFGCGPGQFVKSLADAGYSVEGCDLSPQMIDQAKADYPELDFWVWDGQSALPDGKQDFDVVVSKLTLHLTPDLAALAKSLKGAVKQSGYLIFSIPHPTLTLQGRAKGKYWEEAIYNTQVGSTDVSVDMIHRNFENLLRPFLVSGWALVALEEPQIPAVLADELDLDEFAREIPKRLNVKLQKQQ